MSQDRNRRRVPGGGSFVPRVLPRHAPPSAAEVEPRVGPQVVALQGEEDVLSGILSRARAPARPHRGTEYLHVSDVISKCVRKRALIERGHVPLAARRLSLMEALTFGQGDTIHDVVKLFATYGGPDRVWGQWACKCQAYSTTEPCLLAQVPPEPCNICNTPRTLYKEVSVYDEEHKLVGHPDLLLWMPVQKALYVTELKSISAAMYADLARPLPDHVIQIMMYWRMLRNAGHRVTDKVSILYITKGHTFRGAPYKEFTLDAVANEHRLEPFLADAAAVVAARNGGPLPPRIHCASPGTTEARACEAASLCFAPDGQKAVRVTFHAAAGVRTGR